MCRERGGNHSPLLRKIDFSGSENYIIFILKKFGGVKVHVVSYNGPEGSQFSFIF